MRDMQLRTHPKMKWEGFSNWPPSWAGSYGRVDVLPEEEEGLLTGVEMVEAGSASACHLNLRREHLGKTSEAVLHCDDEEAIPRLFEVLKGCVGWEISRIGDLDVDL
ncbi:MAG: hypothetical protein WB580_12590 [Candidatus Binataceae bacterium]